jgi:hypothetical protein
MNSVSVVLVLAVVRVCHPRSPRWRRREGGDPPRRNQTDNFTVLTIDKNVLQPVANVKAATKKGGQKVATSLVVMPSR